MSRDETADEIRRRRLRDMGEDLGAIYGALCSHMSWLHMRWIMYRQLFAESQERLDVLNECAAAFFGMLRRTLYEDILLELARLTDPVRSRGKDNLTLLRLPDLIPDAALASETRTLVDDALRAADFARTWRHRRLAHRDLALALDTPGEPLPAASREEVEQALVSCRAVLNKLELAYWNSTTLYEHGIIGPGDADALVYHLERGLRAEREERAEFRAQHSIPERDSSEEP